MLLDSGRLPCDVEIAAGQACLIRGDLLGSPDRDDLAAGHGLVERALKAPLRPGREVADFGRREEAQTLLANIEKDLKVIASPTGRR